MLKPILRLSRLLVRVVVFLCAFFLMHYCVFLLTPSTSYLYTMKNEKSAQELSPHNASSKTNEQHLVSNSMSVGLNSFSADKIHKFLVYERNQANSQLSKWEAMSNSNENSTGKNLLVQDTKGYHVLYNVTSYGEYWEPILVMPYKAPLFEERFIGYGFVRNSQVYELHARNYKFQMLDNAFLIHWGFQTTSTYNTRRKMQIKANQQRYNSFKKELKHRINGEMKAKVYE
ncbi:Beta-1,4-glucuronyltransferase 1 [Halocaridina rubra]|uniref:Beta-1,4-glucuronyltransferase 1 n=1 Tax=Halocaridina rubra TaxID=373956 RepID=A0AAN8X4L4_HALRR